MKTRKKKIVCEESRSTLPGPRQYKVVQTVNCTEPHMGEYITKLDIDQLLEEDDALDVVIKPLK